MPYTWPPDMCQRANCQFAHHKLKKNMVALELDNMLTDRVSF